MLRRFVALCCLAPLGGCGALSGVQSAFSIPVAPTPSPREVARAKNSRAFDSLGKSLGGLNSKTLSALLKSGKTTPGAATRAARQPAPFAPNPARELAGALGRGADVPLSPRQIAVSIPSPRRVSSLTRAPLGTPATQTVPARRVQSARLTTVAKGALSDETRAFLLSWAARESLRRADDEVLGRRALEDRIALEGRQTRPALELSCVSPAVQLELSNLRLELLPLLATSRQQRAQAQARINAIETRLNAIWQAETDRQSALLRQSLVEVPARLRVEGESALQTQTRQSAAQSRAHLAALERDLRARSVPVAGAPSPLDITLRAATAPDLKRVRARLVAPASRSAASAPPIPRAPLEGTTAIKRRGPGTSPRAAEVVAAKNERVWRQAVR